ncbi:hypothetical protein KP509_11G011700 [Ceratopteris richardii]|uniref:Growth-regulating factor n=2 Tax=Ceratopteris richardii TaxID=49495 RepID=A0A8T2TSW1_CERRI|nr:hypothetical protein KP509_11G011700 [Ceratopteris richardii]
MKIEMPGASMICLQPQGYSLGHETTGNTPSSTMLLSENCKLDKMSGNLGKTSGNFLLGLADPQPGRCRRTDGKKWRCGRAVVPEQKYCERHMHRGRGRSKAAKLARFSGGVDMNRLHNTERHPNPPYIELLNHLSVPAEPFSQPLGVAQHSSVSAQALMVPETTQSLQQEYVHAPNFMQHAVAESSEQLVTGSNVIDSPTNQSPMQAEPLNLLQSNGRLPVLAQAIPMNEVTKVKFRHDPVNGSVTDEARVTIQDPNDILSLDVQAIKQLLENAPCSMRPRNSMNRQQQLLNVADLLNVAHIRNLHSQPKKPPPLMDILRMVNPATASNTSLNSISLIDHQSKSMIDDNQIAHNDHYAQVVMDSSGARDDRTVLSLACTDKALENQNSQYRLNKVSAVSSSSRMQSEGKMLPMSIEFDTQGGEGYDQDKQVAGRFRRYSEGECIESMTKDDSAGPLSDLTEGCGNRLENISYRASEVANGSHSGLHSLVEKDKDCFRSSNNFNRQNLAEESSRCRSIENLKSIRSDVKHSTAAQESNKQYKSSTSVEEKGNPSSKNGVINFQEKYMKSESCNVIFLEEERSDTCSSSSSEKTLDEHGDSGATEMISPIAKKRMDKKENFVNLDMNRPILDVEDMSQHGDNGLRRLSATSMLGVVSAFEQSSSEVESFNRNGFPKSTLTLEPVPLSNPEQTTQISLVN